jgi:hypothetical protein
MAELRFATGFMTSDKAVSELLSRPARAVAE